MRTPRHLADLPALLVLSTGIDPVLRVPQTRVQPLTLRQHGDAKWNLTIPPPYQCGAHVSFRVMVVLLGYDPRSRDYQSRALPLSYRTMNWAGEKDLNLQDIAECFQTALPRLSLVRFERCPSVDHLHFPQY